MQRFKNLTKKSGKVASAILSAAMVTSMVLGTNVVEVKAAENDTEVAVDVQNGGVNNDSKDVEAVNDAKAYLEGQLKSLPVNIKTFTGLVADDGKTGVDIKTTTVKEFKDAFTNVPKYYNTVSVDSAKIYNEKAVTDNADGVARLEITLTSDSTPGADAYTDTLKIKYTIESNAKRVDTAVKLINENISDVVSGITFPSADDDNANGTEILTELDKVIPKETVDGTNEGDSLKKYEDINTTDGTFDLEPTGKYKFKAPTDTKNGSAKGQIKVTIGNVSKVVDFDVPVLSNSAKVEEATKIIKQLKLDNTNTDSVGAFEAAADALLVKHGFTTGAVTFGTGGDVTTIDREVATTSKDGKADVKFLLSYNGYTADDAVEASYTLMSDETVVKDRLAELSAAADVAGPKTDLVKHSADVQAEYEKQLITALNEAQKDYLGKGISTKTVAGYNTDAAKLYGNPTLALNVSNTSSGDTVSTGEYTALITVKSGDKVASVTKTIGQQTETGKAAAAVQAALDTITVTNDTESADIEKTVRTALEKDGIVATIKMDSFSKTKATNDVDGSATAVIEVKTVTGKTTVTKNYTITKLAPNGQFVEKDGKKFYYDKAGKLLKNTFLQGTDSPDGYTYYIQNDGSVMQDRLTYHPNGKDVIYFDAEGHEVFDAFVNVKKDVQGNAVDYIGYFGTLGGAYVNQTTYGNGVGAYSKDALFYINDYGVLENKGWFQNAAGNIGYAAANGTLTTNQWGLDQFGRKVYFQADGFLAKGLITDGVKYYQLDETDGHLVGEF